MNKHLVSIKAILEKKKAGITAKLAQAGITAEQKTRLNEVLNEINSQISELEAAAEDATAEQLAAIFSRAVETLTAASDQNVQQMQSDVQAMIDKLQAQINVTKKSKKFIARLSFSVLKASTEKSNENFKPFSAGVDVTAWTPEAEVDNVEIFHPLIGVAQGFDVSTTSNTSVKVRGYGITSGKAAYVANHSPKPVIEMAGTQGTANVATIAGVVEGVADEDLEDNAGLEAEIQQEALYNLAEVENEAAIALLENVGGAYSNVNFGTKIGADSKTGLIAIVDQLRQKLGKRQSDICLALNSSQWALLSDLRNQNGTPIPVDSILGDVVKIVDNSLTGDNFYCWAKRFAKIKIYKNATAEWYKGIKSTVVDGNVTAVYSEWRTDEQSVRVRQRQVMYISDSSLVIKGSLAGVVEAITEVQG